MVEGENKSKRNNIRNNKKPGVKVKPEVKVIVLKLRAAQRGTRGARWGVIG
jgi:hypothetical protein